MWRRWRWKGGKKGSGRWREGRRGRLRSLVPGVKENEVNKNKRRRTLDIHRLVNSQNPLCLCGNETTTHLDLVEPAFCHFEPEFFEDDRHVDAVGHVACDLGTLEGKSEREGASVWGVREGGTEGGRKEKKRHVSQLVVLPLSIIPGKTDNEKQKTRARAG